MIKLAVSLLVSLTVGDECSFYFESIIQFGVPFHEDSSSAEEMDDGTDIDPFCNDEGICQGFFVNSDGHLVHGTEMGASQISCIQAYSKLHQLHWGEVDREFNTRPMPETKIVRPSELEELRSDDANWARNQKFYRKLVLNPGQKRGKNEREAERWTSRQYPVDVRADISSLESLIQGIVETLVSSFPRISVRNALPDDWLDKLVTAVDAVHVGVSQHDRKNLIVSIFRNTPAMRTYMWYMHAMIQYSLKETEPTILAPFLAGSAPFIFAFTYIENRLGIHYPGMYEYSQNFLTTLFQIQSPIPDLVWHMSLHDEDQWTFPELPLFPNALIDWGHVFSDARIKLPPRDGITNVDSFLTGSLSALLDGASRSSFEDIRQEQLLRASVLLVYMNSRSVEISEVCLEHADFLNELVKTADSIPESLSYQAVMAILGRCNSIGFLSLASRLQGIVEVWSPRARQLDHRRIWVRQEMMPSDLVTRLSLMDAHSLAGYITISVTSMDEEGESIMASAVPGGLKLWLSEAVEKIFSPDEPFFELVERDDGCVEYKPTLSNASEDDVHIFRGIGRLLALYLRQGYADSVLGKYMHACEDSDSVEKILFFNSSSIRKGFYDVFVEGDFERALLNGREVEQMLTLVNSETEDRVVYWTNADRLATV